jgi:hypothetical protein
MKQNCEYSEIMKFRICGFGSRKLTPKSKRFKS